MNIVMSFDNNFLLPAIVSIYSMFKYNDDVSLKVLYSDLSDTAKTIIKRLECVGSNNSIEYVVVEQYYIDRIKVNTGRWRAETFYRYYAHEIFGEMDRCIWIDSDTLVRRSIKELYNCDFDNCSFCGVYDSTSNPKERIDIDNYINAGVLLMNLQKLRDTGKMEEFWELVASDDYKGELPDQDALNIVFRNDIKIINNKWNAFPMCLFSSDEVFRSYIDEAAIVHFVSSVKPWREEDLEVLSSYYNRFPSLEIFVNEYLVVCDEAVSYVEPRT